MSYRVMSRRKMVVSGATALAAGTTLLRGYSAAYAADPADARRPREGSAEESGTAHVDQRPMAPGVAGKDYRPVVTPNGATLPWEVIDGVKVFHLVAEEFMHEFAPGLKAWCWGYNGRTPGPTIEVVEGDRIRLYVSNRLPEPTSVHWHGIFLPSGMDGVSGLNQRQIDPGETFKYEFTLRQHGTFMYHSHFDEMVQMALGMMGMFIVHPRVPETRPPDRDFAIMLSEWRIDPGTERPNPMEMTDFNILTMNSRAFPGTAPLVAKLGDRVRIRFGNLGAMDHHPIHLHGYRFHVIATDGGQIPEAGQWPETTVLVAVGSTRTIEFVADELGDWAMHCHMTHHVMNQMGHDLPNTIGIDPEGLDAKINPLLPEYMTMGDVGMGGMGEMGMPVPKNSIPMVGAKGPFSYIDMGGMFTILKVRADITSYEDPGWYRHPEGTVANPATADDLRRDRIRVPAMAKAKKGGTKHGGGHHHG